MKLIKGLISFVLILVLAVIVGVIVLGFMVFNTTNETPDYVDKSLTVSEVLSEETAVALANTSETDVVDLALDEVAINKLLGAVIGALQESGYTFIKAAYVDFIDGAFVLYVPLEYKSLASLLSAAVVFSESDISFTATLKQVSLGSLRVVSSFSRSIFKTFIEEKKLEEACQKVGLDASIDISALSVTITKESLKSVLGTILVGDETNAPLYQVLFDVFFDTDGVTQLALGEHEVMGATINLEQLAYDELTNGTNVYAFTISSAKTLAASALTKKLVAPADITTLINLLVFGYTNLSDEEQALADGWDLSSIGISDVKTYTSLKTKEEVSVASIIASRAETFSLADFLLTGKASIEIDELSLNKVLYNLPIVGKSFAASFYDDEAAAYKVSTITVEGMWFDFMTSGASLKLLISVNGSQIVMSIAFAGTEEAETAITLAITSIAFGSITLSEEDQKTMIGYLNDLTNNESWLTFDKEEKTMKMDFSLSLPSDNEAFTAIAAQATAKETSFSGEALADDGCIVISYAFS